MTDDGLRTLVVGIDAASLPRLDAAFELAELDTLRSLVEGGVAAPLESQLPPWTPSAWPSLFTGTNPGKHGVFSFLRYEGYDWDVVDANGVDANALWHLLDHQGLTSVVVNVPVTHPPPGIDGAVVPGFTAPVDPTCHPPGLLDDLRDELGAYRVYGDHEFAEAPDRAERLAEYRELVGMRGAAFRYLAERFDPEFGFLQFQQTDTAVHDFPGDERLLADVYEAVDEQVGATIDATDPDAVFVVSDHGIGPYDGREFRANEFLRREGFLETTRTGSEPPSWVPIWESDLGGGSGTGDGESDEATGDDSGLVAPVVETAVQAGVGAANRAGLSPARAVDVLDRLGLVGVARRLAPDAAVDTVGTGERVDFAASTAYVRLPVELGVRLNVAGREPDGVVDPGEYDAVREQLIERLRAVRTPDGDPVFEAVCPREDVFEGPHVERAVDVVTVPAGFEQFPAARLGDVFGPLDEPWNHKRDGLFVAAGPAVDADAAVGHPHLLDVAPTVLATLDVPHDERMDGTPLPVAPAVGSQSYPRLAGSASDDRPTDESVTARLESLGYLE